MNAVGSNKRHFFLPISVALTLVITILAVGVASSLAAGSKVQAGSITFVDTAGGANFQQFFKEIIPQAEQELGLQISYVPSSAPELLQRLRSGQANQDVILLKPDGLTSLLSNAVPLVHLQSRRPKIPNLSLVADADIKSVLGVPTYGQAVPFWRDQFGIIYDKAKIKNPPKSWQDFYNRRNEWGRTHRDHPARRGLGRRPDHDPRLPARRRHQGRDAVPAAPEHVGLDAGPR